MRQGVFAKIGVILIAFFMLTGLSWANSYRVSAEDVLTITVFDEPELGVEEARIPTDGFVSLPLIGQVHVAGLTPAEIAKAIERKLADGYLKSPRVTVSIAEYRQFYVNGAVEKPGGYSYQEGLTVQKAIVLAGGFTERASERKITLEREKRPNQTEHASMNTLVFPGDVVTVGESFF